MENPPPADWLTWRRGFDYQGFSPLKQITKSNVNNLRVAWTWTLPPGANEATPLVHDGVMLVHGFGDSIQALDAATADLLWQYSRDLPKGLNPSVKRNIAIYGNQVYLGTSDVHIVALDVKSGKVAWDRAITSDRGFQLTGGPFVAKGKVMIGTGGRVSGGNYIVALDAKTGKKPGALRPSRSRANPAAIPGTIIRWPTAMARRCGLRVVMTRSSTWRSGVSRRPTTPECWRIQSRV